MAKWSLLLYTLLGLVPPAMGMKQVAAGPPATPTVTATTVSTGDLSPQAARFMGERLAIFGYALVAHYQTLWRAHSPDAPQRTGPYQCQFFRQGNSADVSGLSFPNTDTTYAECALDLRVEPTVLQVPAMKQRYYSLQFISLTTDDFGYVGTRSTGTDAGTFLIVGPNWQGKIPAGIKQVLRSPSYFAIAALRIAISNDADLAQARQLENQVKVRPLSQFLKRKPPAPPARIVWPPVYDARQGNLDGFLRTLSFMMRWHVFSPLDQLTLSELEKIGLRPAQDFNRTALSPETWTNLAAGFESGRTIIAQRADGMGQVFDSWHFAPSQVGDFGPDYVNRSAAVRRYRLAPSQLEVMAPTTRVDARNQPLDGSQHRYVLEFPPGQTPPAKFFWSLRLYDPKTGLIIKHPINRYAIGNRTPGLKTETDGTLRIYIQAQPPSSGRSNWLPAPKAPFYLTLRLYGPEPAALRRHWLPPSIQRVEE